MTIQERLKAKETKVGRFLKREVTIILAICSIVGGANEYLAMVPADWIPMWVKTLVPIAGLISFVSGKLTVEKPVDGSK